MLLRVAKGQVMAIKQEIKDATKILDKLYKKIRAEITNEQWQQYLEEIKQKQIELDGKVLEGAELEATAEANLKARIAFQTQSDK